MGVKARLQAHRRAELDTDLGVAELQRRISIQPDKREARVVGKADVLRTGDGSR